MNENIVEIKFSNSDMRTNGVYAADQYGNEMPFYEGYKIVKNRDLTTLVKIVRERKWARRKQFQKEVQYTTKYENRPCKTALIQDDCIIMHPYYYDDVRACTATRMHTGFGGMGAYMAQRLLITSERPGFLRQMLGEKE
jgi:hypothetical protein